MSIPSAGVGSLSTLLQRLEAATSRLEDIALARPPTASETALLRNTPSAPPAAARHSTEVSASVPSASPASTNAAVQGFEEIIEVGLAKYVKLSNEIGGLVSDQAALVRNAFLAQLNFIQLASSCTQLPTSSPHYAALLAPTQEALVAVVGIKEMNRPSKQINQLNTVSEGIPALGWVTLETKPGPYVGDMKESSQFYANRVVKDHKESDPKQVEWARSYIAVLEDLRKYIMQFHATGLTWNPKGVDPTSYSSTPNASLASAAAPSTSKVGSSSPLVASPGNMGGVFASLNKGEGVTSGLKKVDKREMTHKNPELRVAGVIADNSSIRPTKPPKPQAVATKKPAVTNLEGNKWIIENHENNASILIEQTGINQIVNVFNVKSSVIQIKGKVNAISLVNCSKTSILLDSTVSSLSISNCPSFTAQILGKVPTILIDGTDGGQVYLSAASLEVEIVTSKSSSINISLPVGGEEEGVFEEKAVPEQMKTIVQNGKLVTTIVEHSS